MSGVSVSLWVKAEPFSYGALPVTPHPRLNFSNIKKIVIYAKNKGETGFPLLSYSVWKHIACNKLHLTEDLAWMYFSSCHLFCDSVSPVERIEWDEKFVHAQSQAKADSLRLKLSVDTYKMVLYLYIQQLYRVSLRASLVAGDEWPTQSSVDLEGRSTPRGTKSMDDHSHLVFVQNHLSEMLELLAEPDSIPRISGSQPGNLSLRAIEALSCLLDGSIDKFKSLLPLQEIATMPVVHVHSGYSKVNKTFSVRIFQTWVKDYLTQNPFGVSACIASGVRLSWPFAGDDSKSDVVSSTKRGKIATNANIVPKANTKGNKMIIMSQVGKQTVARSSGTLEMSCVKIHRCHYSFLYLLSPLRSVTIEKCRYTTVVLGPVETSIHFSNCENVTLIACSRNVMVSGCTLCTLHLMTPTRPLLLGGNDTVLLAPYHTHYPRLEEHMAKVGITAHLNVWDQPLCVGPDHRDDQPIWELLPVQEFFTFNIPFEITGPTNSIPGGLPSRYQRAVTQRQKAIDRWQKMVKDAGLTRDQRKEFQSLVETRFHIWLAETGHKREVDSLVVPLQTTKQ
ncbi:TBCC domain-containing protein 1-like isoform X2 [Gigantopelta aegis]|uniref:TBCC domain-containing protein 1-like isoform X1 n=1 Tax=Gigantopelta aegis TaxID=1735272 RepID=UPI001B8894BE|nr:TBCC domain-containing protein 1-like isoform X1 [Gigantopelta aegis]XP_041350330.1 TBCC domain-containing protein 1-like isoform X2 [Gigantopelta aegis]